jgi:hypothetical protein
MHRILDVRRMLSLTSHHGWKSPHEEVPKTEPVRVFARIHEARMEGDQLRLVMAGGVEIAADQVEALRMP